MWKSNNISLYVRFSVAIQLQYDFDYMYTKHRTAQPATHPFSINLKSILNGKKHISINNP